jgi:hypothetical protein
MEAEMIRNEVGGAGVLARAPSSTRLACGKLLSSPPDGPILHKPNKVRQK